MATEQSPSSPVTCTILTVAILRSHIHVHPVHEHTCMHTAPYLSYNVPAQQKTSKGPVKRVSHQQVAPKARPWLGPGAGPGSPAPRLPPTLGASSHPEVSQRPLPGPMRRLARVLGGGGPYWSLHAVASRRGFRSSCVEPHLRCTQEAGELLTQRLPSMSERRNHRGSLCCLRRRARSHTPRAEVTCSLSLMEHLLREGHYTQCHSASAPVFLAAIVEYLTTKNLLELAGNEAHNLGRKHITPDLMDTSVLNNVLLSGFSGSTTYITSRPRPGVAAHNLARSRGLTLPPGPPIQPSIHPSVHPPIRPPIHPPTHLSTLPSTQPSA
ncbi:uncharacterized protein LOC102475648 [Tupaia chinensis]|uniref:uncharacterized protein LOC102475648 n=1 Tax=Tupaia chinensis TaxID=246437 RepID=UPI0007044D84|nr:uncharacterized protein LOC102475648 [Tupaia chinensis]